MVIKKISMLSSAETKIYPIVGILTFISWINYRLWWSLPEIYIYLGYFILSFYEQLKFHAQLS